MAYRMSDGAAAYPTYQSHFSRKAGKRSAIYRKLSDALCLSDLPIRRHGATSCRAGKRSAIYRKLSDALCLSDLPVRRHEVTSCRAGKRSATRRKIYRSLLCAQAMPLAYSGGSSGTNASSDALSLSLSLSFRLRWPTLRPSRTSLSYQCRCTSGSFSQS